MKRTSDDADIDFEAMFNLPKRAAVADANAAESPQEDDVSTKSKDKNRLTRCVLRSVLPVKVIMLCKVSFDTVMLSDKSLCDGTHFVFDGSSLNGKPLPFFCSCKNPI